MTPSGKTVGFITSEKVRCLPENSVGSSRIRARWLWENWPEAEEWMVGRPGYEVLIFQKAYAVSMLTMMDIFKGISIFDICDPDWLDNEINVFEYLNKADAVTASSAELANYVKKLLPDKLVVHIPDRINFSEHTEVKKTHAEELQHLVWFGYSHNFVYVQPALRQLAESNISLTVYSDTQIEIPQDINIDFKWHKYEYQRLHKDLRIYDAALLPTERGSVDVRGSFKTNNKALTCYALGLPVIETPADVERLQSASARKKEAREKMKLVKDNYDVKQSVQQYKDIIKQLK